MTRKIAQTREAEHATIASQIKATLQSENIYEKEEATKKMLLAQVNHLKGAIKVEIEARRTADEEILASLTQYQSIIEKEVTKQRSEVVRKKKGPDGASD